MESRLQVDWNDLQAWERLNEAQQKLEEFLMDKLKRRKMKVGATWAHMEDKCIKEFFQCHKQIRLKTKIKEILDGSKSLRI
jgi:molybdenum-dependent DNA-binding transcriptional regulator ModE